MMPAPIKERAELLAELLTPRREASRRRILPDSYTEKITALGMLFWDSRGQLPPQPPTNLHNFDKLERHHWTLNRPRECMARDDATVETLGNWGCRWNSVHGVPRMFRNRGY